MARWEPSMRLIHCSTCGELLPTWSVCGLCKLVSHAGSRQSHDSVLLGEFLLRRINVLQWSLSRVTIIGICKQNMTFDRHVVWTSSEGLVLVLKKLENKINNNNDNNNVISLWPVSSFVQLHSADSGISLLIGRSKGKSIHPLHAQGLFCLHLSPWPNGNVSQIKLNTNKLS